MSRHDVVRIHDFRSAMKSKEKLSSMKSVRFDGTYTGKEAEVGHGGVCLYIYIWSPLPPNAHAQVDQVLHLLQVLQSAWVQA